MEYEEDEDTIECAECHARIDLGRDLIRLEQGVLGPRGLVPLENAVYFCSESCMQEHVCGNEATVEKRPRRMP